MTMPASPPHPCKAPGCAALVAAGAGAWCPAHQRTSPLAAHRSLSDRLRGTAHARGYTARWQRAARLFLDRWPLCLGILIPTDQWIQPHAEEFARIRDDEWRDNGNFSTIAHACLAYLSLHPIYTVAPWDVGRPATVVDHIKPHKGDPVLFWSEWNWQPATKRAHDKKTAREDRGAWAPNIGDDRRGVSHVRSGPSLGPS